MESKTRLIKNTHNSLHTSPLSHHTSHLSAPISQNGITLVALVVTIVLNFSYLEMARMNKFEKI